MSARAKRSVRGLTDGRFEVGQECRAVSVVRGEPCAASGGAVFGESFGVGKSPADRVVNFEKPDWRH